MVLLCGLFPNILGVDGIDSFHVDISDPREQKKETNSHFHAKQVMGGNFSGCRHQVTAGVVLPRKSHRV